MQYLKLIKLHLRETFKIIIIWLNLVNISQEFSWESQSDFSLNTVRRWHDKWHERQETVLVRIHSRSPPTALTENNSLTKTATTTFDDTGRGRSTSMSKKILTPTKETHLD